jgi:iron complex outermembrane receptor protein
MTGETTTKRTIALTGVLMGLLPSAVTAQEIEEIIVTSRKRDENLYAIPVSVTAFSTERLEAAGVDNPEDLSAFVPGFSFATNTGVQGRTNPDLRFRGMAQQVNTPSTQVGALFWDGSYIGAGGGFLPLGDLERVEVIKGPQTAQFGRNTFSGAINYIPRMPGDAWEGTVAAGWSPSQEDDFNASLGVGGPISATLGTRVWFGYDREGGDHRFADGSRFGRYTNKTVSSTTILRPSDPLELKLTGYYAVARNIGENGSVAATHPAGTCNRTVSGQYINPVTGVRTPFTRDLRTLNFAVLCDEIPGGEGMSFPLTARPTVAQITGGATRQTILQRIHPLLEKYGIIKQPYGGLGGDNQTWRVQVSGSIEQAGHTLSLQASHAQTGLTNVLDNNLGLPNNAVVPIGSSTAVYETYYEARVASPQDQAFRYLVGVSDYGQRYRNGTAPLSTELTPGTFPAVDFQNNSTLGVFGSIDYDITDTLTASIEARYTDEKFVAVLFGSPNLRCGLITLCNAENRHKDFIPRAILTYKPSTDTTLYASYSYSSLLGLATQARFINSIDPTVISTAQLQAAGDFTPPQENTQYEVGWKQQGANWAFTSALYYAQWKNQPFAAVVFFPSGVGTSSFRLPGESEYLGVDVEGNVSLSDWFDISGSLGWVDAKLKTFSSRGTNEVTVLGSGSLSVVSDGNRPRYIPTWTASLTPTIKGMVGEWAWYLRTDLFYQSSWFIDFSEFNRSKGAVRVNVRLGVDVDERTRVELFGTNLTNNARLPSGSTTGGPNNSRKFFSAPYTKREFGIRIKSNF